MASFVVKNLVPLFCLLALVLSGQLGNEDHNCLEAANLELANLVLTQFTLEAPG